MRNRVLKNAGWIIGCQIIQSMIRLVIGLMTARYLGPAGYGVISYAASVAAFVTPIMQIGFRNTLVKELVDEPGQEGRILGSALIMNMISAVLCIIGSVSFVMLVHAGERETVIVCALYSLSLLFQAAETMQYWFQTRLLSRYSSVAALAAYSAVSVYKIWLLVTKKDVVWFALSVGIEYLLLSLLLLLLYVKAGGQRLCVDWHTGKKLLSRSKYYILPALMVMAFQHTDRIMIRLMIGERETGFYAAAITCVGMSSFVFSAILDSARPVILEEKQRNPALYERRIIQLYSIITCLSVAQSVGMTLLARPLVCLLYGAEYAETAGILAVAVWYVAFGYFGSVRNIWILAENKQKYLSAINGAGVLANILLNLCLIPLWGATGAAVASVITQFFTNVIVGFICKPMAESNRLMIRGLHPRVLLELLDTAIHRR